MQLEDGSVKTTGIIVSRAIDGERALYPGESLSAHRFLFRFTDKARNAHEGDMNVSPELYEKSAYQSGRDVDRRIVAGFAPMNVTL